MRSANNTSRLSKRLGGKKRWDVPREARRCLGSLRDAGRGGAAHRPRGGRVFQLDSEVRGIEHGVQSLSPDDLLERYHELIDRRFAGHLSVAESFELKRIEARLNLEDQKEVERIAGFEQEWRRDRDGLIRSVEDLLGRLKMSA